MKPLLLVIVLCAFSFNTLFPQSFNWSWVHGDSAVNKFGIYGSKGLPAPQNKPGARNRSNNWKDMAGNLWMFGGGGCATKNSGYLNDLWKYSPVTNQWAWIHGDSTPNKKSYYGTIGVAAAGNKPGARKNCVTWRDASDNLWLFGGYGYSAGTIVGNLNDLWKYNTTTNQWTWIKGDTITNVAGLYGNKGISSPTRKPGARQLSTGWTDNQGNLWLFGGLGYDENGVLGDMNDLWKYTPATNKWTWIKGDSTVNKTGIYGLRGSINPTNCPGARAASVSWQDGAGNFFLLGGYGYDDLNLGYLSDLWKYNTNTNQWSWINGNNKINIRPSYGARGVPSPGNSPGARDFSLATNDAGGQIWLFGGFGYPSNGFGYLNDLWRYDNDSNQWTWVNGDMNDNVTGIYGSMGTNSNLSKPGSRQQGVVWTDANGVLWIFGGQGYNETTLGSLNDMWKYSPENLLPVQLISFTGKKQNTNNVLNWTVENETNFDRYDVEKSNNGKDFIKSGSIKALGTKNYQFVDELSILQNQHYRLKLIDKDGKWKFSNTVSVYRDKAENITIYPNPAVNVFYLKSDKILNGKISVEIIDINGKVLGNQSINANNNYIAVNIDHIPPGVYQVRMIHKDEYSTQPLVIVK